MVRRCWVAAIALLVAAPGWAQEEESAAEAAGPWSGTAALGFLSTSGNTDSSSLNGGLEINYKTGNWRHRLRGRAINTSQDNATTAEAYNVDWRSNYDFSETSYVVGVLDWRKDRFSGFPRQFSQTVAYGRRLIETEKHRLNAELGGGAKQLDAADGTETTDFIVRGDLDYTWAFSESASFEQEFLVESGDTNTFIESISSVKARLIGELALVASYTIRNNSEVPSGTDETDTFAALSLEYAF